MTKRLLGLILPLCAALAVACGGDGSIASAPPTQSAPKRVLTRLEVTGSSSLIAGYAAGLTVTAWDQFGEKMLDGSEANWWSMATFVSSRPQIAIVKEGRLTAVGAGTATISGSLTLDGVTMSASMVTKVDLPAVQNAFLMVDNGRQWTPYEISVRSGSTVTWYIPDGVQLAPMYFNVLDDSAERMDFVNGLSTRTFTTPGFYYYGTGGGLMWNEEGGVIRVY